MKRIKQLQPLSRDHHLSLVLAQYAIKMSQSDNAEIIALSCKKIVKDYPEVWRKHFQIEEDNIFKLFEDNPKDNNTIEPHRWEELKNLCQQLQHEHRQMDGYYEQMKLGHYECLSAFGQLLKQHTRTEERQLFPQLEQVLSQQELDTIYQNSLKNRPNKRL